MQSKITRTLPFPISQMFLNNHDYVGRPLDIKPCVSVTPHINNHDYFCRPLDIKPCVSEIVMPMTWYRHF
jgi:hypothetical protein